MLAFYYMWYGPDAFSPTRQSDQPAAPYISDHPDVIDRQVREAQAAGIDAFISSWTGTGTETDRNFSRLLDTAAAHDFRATIYFETQAAMQHGDVATQLQSALSRFAGQPAYLRWNGKPVVFFWAPQALGGPDAWAQVRRQVDPQHQQIWSVDTTDARYLDVFDSIHLFSGGKWGLNTNVAAVDMQWRGLVDAYNAAHGTDRFWVADVIPGWDESRIVPPRPNAKVFPRQDTALYSADWQAAVTSRPAWIAITSYNEWSEGTQIEPSVTYGTRYLDLTRQYAGAWKGPNLAAPSPCDGGPLFPQTGHRLCAAMAAYWQQYGGLAQFGYPISDPLVETSPTDGQAYTAQYFERARFELHPEHAGTPYGVQLSLLGRQMHPPDPAVPVPAPGTPGQYFPQTGHLVPPAFAAYWAAHGGLFVNGYPISEAISVPGADGHPSLVQYFERARFEFHPANPPPYQVLLGLLGQQAWAARSGR
ncbi:MAG: endo-1,3-alpha-glucanase family glycosylhydrolase [Acidimicrobiales bacterium]